MDDLIYILLGIAWILYAAYRAGKKRKAAPPARQGTQEEAPKPFQTLLEDMMKEDSLEEYTPEAESYDEKTIREIQMERTLLRKPVLPLETIPLEEGISAFSPGQQEPVSVYSFAEEEIQEPGQGEGSYFDLRKAIIYNAILHRPYN
jgi:hypothetical protein